VVTGRIVTVDGRWKTRNSHGLILQILVGNQTWLGGKSTIIGYNWRIMEVLHNGKIVDGGVSSSYSSITGR
jgi:hypothetical protein